MTCAQAFDSPPPEAQPLVVAGHSVWTPAAKSVSPVEAFDREIPIPSYWIGLYGGVLGAQDLRLRFAGNLDGPRVLALGGISAGRFVADEGRRGPGWWGGVARRGGGIDLDHYCVIGFDYPSASEVVDLCPEDYADLAAYALKEAGVGFVDAVVGASFGGMIGLAFARKFPERIGKLCTISAADRPHPMAQAWRLVQRRIIDFAAEKGAPEAGVALARELAMTTYRTPEEFAVRFTPDLAADDNVGSYLAARGDAYAREVSAARYATLSAAIDRHDEKPEAIETPALVIGVDSDRLVPLCDVEALQRRIGGPSTLEVITSPYGHDAFLKESDAINTHLNSFLRQEPS